MPSMLVPDIRPITFKYLYFKINTFFYENDLSLLRSLRDPYGKLSSTLGILGLPTTLIIDPTGNEIGRIIGDIDWSSEKSINFFQLVIDKYNL